MIPVLIYNFVIKTYWFGIYVSSFFNAKAKKWINGRQKLFKRIRSEVKTNQKLVWFHCASLGEFEQGRPVIEAFKEKFPEYNVFLTFFSPSGYELRKQYAGADHVFYLPMDSKRNARRLVDAINPDYVFFIKYEFWHHYLQTLYRKNIPVYLISGLFRKNQLFFKSYGKWYREILRCFTHFFVQDGISRDLLRKHGFDNVSVTGDTRFDRVINIASGVKPIPEIEQFKNKKLVVIAGSTWPKDEELLLKYINFTNGDLKWIIAPHEISQSHIDAVLYEVTKPAIRYSRINDTNLAKFSVLIIDNIGMLSRLYQYGELAYIGGGFGKGIHNILEAAAYSIPVVFGPNYRKFSEAVKLKQTNGAFVISNYHNFKSTMDKLIFNRQYRKSCGNIAGSFVSNNTGGTEKIIHFMEKELRR